MTVPGASSLAKSLTGIQGLDEITGGGLPRGRPTLICGGPGCGKTLLAAEFLVRGAVAYGENGVLMTFEETARDLASNTASLGFELERLVAEGRLHIDHVRVERSEIEEAGEYDLDGLFVRLGHAIRKVGAKRVVLDTVETLFGSFQNAAILRSELKRLFHWLKEQEVTAIITAERGVGSLTRHGLEEYVSDCVIFLDHRVDSQVSTRRLRVVKYRGSAHGTSEYPFLIDEGGLTVVPITSAGLDHAASEGRVSTGIADLDEMMGGEGFYLGASVLVSGGPGTGKTTVCAHFVDAACRRGEKAIYFAFEESPAQIVRNMRAIGTDLAPHVDAGLLRFQAARPTLYGLETHLARILRVIDQFEPRAVVLDPITALLSLAASEEVRALIMRLIDALKVRGITALCTTLTELERGAERTDVGISSLMDTWILLRDIELNGERNRGLYILKSRGMEHSNQIREFVITSRGVELVPAYLGPEGVLTGSSRVAQEARLRSSEFDRRQELERLGRRLEQKRAAAEAQIAALRVEIEAEDADLQAALESEAARQAGVLAAEQELARSRHADAPSLTPA